MVFVEVPECQTPWYYMLDASFNLKASELLEKNARSQRADGLRQESRGHVTWPYLFSIAKRAYSNVFFQHLFFSLPHYSFGQFIKASLLGFGVI